ncbi:unnamed protein product [Polarella glacialis]|uniref:Uncharacterized protein n=1 Tax=Polarella glacialis TaxID=89957 RepID=A0A813H1Q5_POLGL|nr:unnamed protein product [Polarella glacialis]
MFDLANLADDALDNIRFGLASHVDTELADALGPAFDSLTTVLAATSSGNMSNGVTVDDACARVGISLQGAEGILGTLFAANNAACDSLGQLDQRLASVEQTVRKLREAPAPRRRRRSRDPAPRRISEVSILEERLLGLQGGLSGLSKSPRRSPQSSQSGDDTVDNLPTLPPSGLQNRSVAAFSKPVVSVSIHLPAIVFS